MLVRFTTLSGREIGRLPQETATFISTLLDQNICFFDGICIFAPDKIRTGDNLLIQLRAYLLPQVFNPLTASKEDRPGVWEVAETEEERALKLRRIGLLHLFDAIGLEPLRTSSMSRQTGNARDQLLQAVQLPDPKVTGMSRSSSSQSSPASGDDDGEGKEVAEDTLNLLYKKAQMYDPDMPTTDPPGTFKFELRKYQKQALCWMIGKESGGEKDVRKQQSLNPLWEEYEWPLPEDATTRPAEGVSEKFYLNPYSGEMSLSLPTYESIHKGGILADGIPQPPFATALTTRNGTRQNNRNALPSPLPPCPPRDKKSHNLGHSTHVHHLPMEIRSRRLLPPQHPQNTNLLRRRQSARSPPLVFVPTRTRRDHHVVWRCVE